MGFSCIYRATTNYAVEKGGQGEKVVLTLMEPLFKKKNINYMWTDFLLAPV
jgi:hypothetical protein